jgi:hypothetical protein
VAVAWSISLIFFIDLVPYELPNMIMVIYVIPMWWIFYSMIWSMRLEPILCKMYW